MQVGDLAKNAQHREPWIIDPKLEIIARSLLFVDLLC